MIGLRLLQEGCTGVRSKAVEIKLVARHVTMLMAVLVSLAASDAWARDTAFVVRSGDHSAPARAVADERPPVISHGRSPDARERNDLALSAAGPRASDQAAEKILPVIVPSAALAPALTAAAAQAVSGSMVRPMSDVAESAVSPAIAARATGRTVILPFSAGTGAAAFRRGDVALVVFDERKPVDMSALGSDPQFATASISLLAAATVLRLPLPPGEGLRLSRVAVGWTVGTVPLGSTGPVLRPIRAGTAKGRMQLVATAPGQVVAVPDPMSGGVVLVGTQAQPGEGMPVERRTPEFTLLPTWLGVAVLPMSDALALRPVPDGFVLGGDPGRGLALSADDADILALSDAGTFSRQFDLPSMPVAGLLRRLQAATATAAAAPAQSRTAPRLAVAQAMIALGLGAEAQSVLTLAGIEDGRVAADPDAGALAAIAALLAGRTTEADGLDNPRLTGSDEIALWRAVKAAMRDEASPQAAPVFAATLKLLRSYPQPLRDRLAPLAIETMALGGEHDAAAPALSTWSDQSGLDLARAMVAEATDQPAALAIYDRLIQGSDRRIRARAASLGAELRLASGRATAMETADTLDRQMYSWRGDGRELALRLRVAELRSGVGEHRRALTLLRETQQFWPDNADLVRPALAAIFNRAVQDAQVGRLSALDLVVLAEENPSLLPEGEEGRTLAVMLAGRLLALDLPARAIPMLKALLEAAPPGGAARSELGSRLALARQQQGDDRGALAALTASMMQGQMPPDLLEDRTLTYARAASATGQLEAAQQALMALGTPAALALRASLLEAARDWRGAAAALGAMVEATVPTQGMLTRQQSQLLLRLAGAAAQNGDEVLLASLRQRHIAQLPPGRAAEMFQLVTASPVRGVADLPRSGQEVLLARKVADGATRASGFGR